MLFCRLFCRALALSTPLALALATGCEAPSETGSEPMGTVATDEGSAAPLASPGPSFRRLGGPTLMEMASRADAVVVGEVVRIAHRLSQEDGAQHRSLPHTFVTFRVEGAAFGAQAGDLLTLRFVGGPDGRGRALVASETPWFRVGDTDLLFVAGNGTSPCPLVGGAQGRFRVVDGSVYDDAGRPVRADSQGRVSMGPKVAGVEVDELNLGESSLWRNGSPPELDETPEGPLLPDSAEDWLSQVGSPTVSRGSKALSMDPEAPFIARSASSGRAVAPRPLLASPVPLADPTSTTDADRAEVAEFLAGGGNPVLSIR